MDFTPTPMLANGMVLLGVYYIWALVLIGVGLFALLALILSLVRRTRKGSRKLAVAAIVVSLAPFVVPVINTEALSRYAHGEAGLFAVLSLLPLGMSVIAAYCSRKDSSLASICFFAGRVLDAARVRPGFRFRADDQARNLDRPD
jgi:hypothetical protein